MKEKKLAEILLSVFFVLCFMGSIDIAYGSEELSAKNQISDVSFGSKGITFHPKTRSCDLLLTVSVPDGTVSSKTFDSGSYPYYELSATSPDGVYNYELRVIQTDGEKIRAEFRGTKKERNHLAEPLVQSGQFIVQGGRILTSGSIEPDLKTSIQDYVINDDLIVTGSLSVGFDSVNGYAFDADTIVLRENNLRIFFDDTSTSSSYPRNDWRILANSTVNGGGSFFSIQDATAERRVFSLEAGAPQNALYVDDNGRVGFGTSTPYTKLHITHGDTPTIRWEQNGSWGWIPQSWDVGGNETNFFIRDVTNGSTLPLRIQPGAPSSSLTILNSGRVGIGTWSPSAKVEIETTGEDATIQLERTDGAVAVMNAFPSSVRFGSTSSDPLRICAGSQMAISVLTNGNVGIGKWNPSHIVDVSGGAYCDGGDWVNGSSIEYKENIQKLSTEEAIEAFQGLNPVKFHYKRDKMDGRVGFIAEEVPDLVATKDRKGLSPMEIVAVLTKVIQNQQETINMLQEKIAKLEEIAQSER